MALAPNDVFDSWGNRVLATSSKTNIWISYGCVGWDGGKAVWLSTQRNPSLVGTGWTLLRFIEQ